MAHLSRRQKWIFGVLAAVVLVAGVAFRERLSENNWAFAGSDSYGYVKLADTWRTEGRYALGPAPEPLHYGRMPLYPLFIRLTKGAAPAEMSGGDGWGRITRAQRWLDVLVATPLAAGMALALGGAGAALLVLACMLLLPFTTLYDAAALSESLATTLTVATLGTLFFARRWPRRAFALAGGLLGLSLLTRPDGILLAVAFVPALALLANKQPHRTRRLRLQSLGLALLAFTCVYAPWPARNLAQFGQPWFVGARVDRYSRPLDHYQGYWNWLRSWCGNYHCQTITATCFLTPPCEPSLGGYPAEAFFDDSERRQVAALFADRTRQGLTPAGSAAFQQLADQKNARARFQTLLWLPLRRSFTMWIADHDEVLQNPTIKVRWLQSARPVLKVLSILFCIGAVIGTTWLLRDRQRRLAAAILAAPLLVRTLILPMQLYSMPRYTVEVWPLMYVLSAAGGALIFTALQNRPRQPQPEAPARHDEPSS